jgi:hypothetical protein
LLFCLAVTLAAVLLWMDRQFGSRFFFCDGEGTSGVGAIGSFDVRNAQVRDAIFAGDCGLVGIGDAARWRRSLDWLDAATVGAAFGGGLLRYNLKTGAVAKFEIRDYIYAIDRAGDAVYCGTSNGLYIVRGGAVTQMKFEPDVSGRLVGVSTGPKPWPHGDSLVEFFAGDVDRAEGSRVYNIVEWIPA